MNKLDASLDDVQNTRFANMYHDLIKQLQKTTQFNETELSSILMIYHKFVLANGKRSKYMTTKQFSNLFLVLFKIYDFTIIDRIVGILSESTTYVDPVAWVQLFSVFLSKNFEEKMKYVFSVYNIHGSGLINREIVGIFVEKFFTGDDEEEVHELRTDMIDMLFRLLDKDKDGFISYEDYSSVVRHQPLMLEFLGQCLPGFTDLTEIAYCANLLSKKDMSQIGC